MKFGLTITLICLILIKPLLAQYKEENTTQKFDFKFAWEVPATGAMYVASIIGFDKMKDKDKLSVSKINSLSSDNVWGIDRVSLRMDASYRFKAQDISDVGLNISLALPALLAFDDKIRKEWLDLMCIYLETQAIVNISYVYGAAIWTERIRPYVYYEEVPLAEKLESGATDSFFSGHIANVAASTFFMAKIYTEFHPEIGNKRWWLYGAALVPPAIVGYYRIRALKHFPTDLVVGTIVGAGLGILIPELHKVNRNENLEVIPLAGNFTGLHLRYKINYKN